MNLKHFAASLWNTHSKSEYGFYGKRKPLHIFQSCANTLHVIRKSLPFFAAVSRLTHFSKRNHWTKKNLLKNDKFTTIITTMLCFFSISASNVNWTPLYTYIVIYTHPFDLLSLNIPFFRVFFFVLPSFVPLFGVIFHNLSRTNVNGSQFN